MWALSSLTQLTVTGYAKYWITEYGHARCCKEQIIK